VPDVDKITIDLNKTFVVTALNEELSSNTKMNVLPNPCMTSFQIETDSPLKKVEIYSLSGVLLGVYDQSNISVSDLKSGIYLLKVTTEKGQYYQRILKEDF
jgi:hypothetical protein